MSARSKQGYQYIDFLYVHLQFQYVTKNNIVR